MKALATAFACFFLLVLPLRAAAEPDEAKMAELAEQAFVFGYPLLMMDASRQQMAGPKTPGGDSMINRFSHMRAFPDHTFVDVVSPNADTLYSIAWLDLKAGPVELALPETGGRYYVMQFMDAWTNDFISLGSRTTGNGPGRYLITGPGWTGDVPAGMVRVESPTAMVWILGRTQTNGKDDYAAVRALQDTFTMRPRSDGADAAPVVRSGEARDGSSPLERVERLSAAEFFSRLNSLMADNPPAPADAPLLAELSSLSIGPGRDFDMTAMTPAAAAAVEKGYARGLTSLAALDSGRFGTVSNGWRIMSDRLGRYGTDYLLRAFIARFAIGANLPEDAVYPALRVDADGRPLNGRNSYVIRFAPGALPPVRAFWSITMYNDKQRFVENAINRYALGDRDALLPDPDGGLTIYVRHDAPGGGRDANWLPAPAGDFNLIMRLYWPEASILDGSWPMPALEKE